MNFESLNKLLRSLVKNARRSKLDIEILSELLDNEIDSDELKRILRFDLNDETELRKCLPKKQLARYRRLGLMTERRKALRIVLASIRIENTLKTLLSKSLFYPVFLFCLSLMMMLFVDGVLFRTFRSMLQFMGSTIEFSQLQNMIRGLIAVDLVLIGSFLMLMFFIKHDTLKMYEWINRYWSDNPWTQLNSYHFASKFVSFYSLGGSFDEIFSQIQLSSDQVLSHGCHLSINALRSGESLSRVVALIDPRLELYFLMNEEGVSIESHLINHNRIQEMLISHRIKQFAKFVLAYSYIKITLVIVVIYQMMLKPIEMMGNYL